MVQQLEKKADPRLRRTYTNGKALEEVIESAPVLKVGLVFLPGADKPQVNRSEQISMEGKEADQKDALWRVATAGSLLSQFNVSQDLSIVETDQTASIVKKAKSKAHECDRGFLDQRKALIRRGQDQDTVTIDSEKVTVVNDFSNREFDLKGLLVEVDWSSLWDLIMDYRTLIARGGPEMTFEETRDLLETMIENARRLCIRSPILFRMSTRSRIINSENTRYGINQGPMFKTLTTSKGIKEIISLSAAYYNSLDPNDSDDSTQQYIRPRFLQMVDLLLSLLNNEDLSEIKDFLEATYKLKPERRDIELLILKVIPLMSINPRVFLKGLILAIESFPLEVHSTHIDDKHSEIWNIFVRRILEYGYILPGTVDDLGRARLSWIVQWPEEGFKSTSIFNTLQYAGRLRAIIDIPPIEVHPGSGCTELTVVMTDDTKYVVGPRDLDSIVYMTPGTYPIQETGGGRFFHDLRIEETLLNGEVYQAIKMYNGIVQTVNHWLANPKRGGNRVTRIVRRRNDPQSFFNDVRGTGRIVEEVATLNRTKLAVTYKVEGKKISRIDAIQEIASDIRRLKAFISYIEDRGDIVDQSFFGSEKRELQQNLDLVRKQIDQAVQSEVKIRLEPLLSHEPIVKCLYPEGGKKNDGNIWNAYTAECAEHNGYLYIDALTSIISDIEWLQNGLIELSLKSQQQKLFVTTLKPTPEGQRHDEVQIGDVAILVGQFVAIGEHIQGRYGSSTALIMTNYLKIVSMEEQTQTRRGKNRRQQSDAKVRTCFK